MVVRMVRLMVLLLLLLLLLGLMLMMMMLMMVSMMSMMVILIMMGVLMIVLLLLSLRLSSSLWLLMLSSSAIITQTGYIQLMMQIGHIGTIIIEIVVVHLQRYFTFTLTILLSSNYSILLGYYKRIWVRAKAARHSYRHRRRLPSRQLLSYSNSIKNKNLMILSE